MLLAACGAEKKPPAPEPPPAVEVAVVRGVSAGGSLSVSGVLERERESALSFRTGGAITALTVDAGDRVSRGQVIATVDPAGVRARLAQAGAELDKARRDQARDKSLADRGFVSQARMQDRGSAVAAASAAYDAVAFDARYSRLVSPVSGPVLERRAQMGEVVQPGQAVVVVADEASPFVVRAPVSDRDVGRLRRGTPAIVRVGGASLRGRVDSIGARAAAQTGAVEVEVRVPASAALRTGMVVQVELEAAPAAAAGPGYGRVPAEAVLEAQGGKAFVYRMAPDGKRAMRTAVSFGGFDGDDALVGGLAPGTRVVTAGAGFIRDGQAVQVIDAASLTVPPA
jgi:RND family efflux transporter MFP subunit